MEVNFENLQSAKYRLISDKVTNEQEIKKFYINLEFLRILLLFFKQYLSSKSDRFAFITGGCIDERDRCDEKVDCIDASDENYLLCGYPKGYVPTTTTTTTTTVRSPTASENNDLLYRIVPDNSTKTVALGVYVTIYLNEFHLWLGIVGSLLIYMLYKFYKSSKVNNWLVHYVHSGRC